MPYADPAKTREYNRAYRFSHLAKIKKAGKDWRAANKDQIRQQKKAYRLRNLEKIRQRKAEMLYGMPRGEFQRLLEKQKGRCACCQRKQKLSVDHCHSTERIRSLLCQPCNTALGQIRDSLSRAYALVRYIKNYCRPPKPNQLPLYADKALPSADQVATMKGAMWS